MSDSLSFEDLVALAESRNPDFTLVSRQDCLAVTRTFAAETRRQIRERHEAGESGSNVVHQLADAADTVLRGVLSFVLASFPNPQNVLSRLSLCALGGYGRGELSPYSDLDVCLLYEGRLDDAITSVNGYLLPFLWDLGFRVGYAIRTVPEAMEIARRDRKVFTSLVESRLVVGSNTTFARLKLFIREYQATMARDEYISTRIAERHERLPEKYQDLYNPEPHVKENVGGIRDFHTALWLLLMTHDIATIEEAESQGLITPDEYLEFVDGLDFLWRIRNELHFHAGRVDDMLTFANQRQVAQAFGYLAIDDLNIPRFMQDYYTAARKVRRFFRIVTRICASPASAALLVSPKPQVPDYTIEDGELYAGLSDDNWFAEQPARLMEVFWQCARHGVILSRGTERLVAENLHLVGDTFRTSDLVRRFFTALCNRPARAGHALRQAAAAGLLGRYIPEFAAVQGLIRYEDFHHYPVDEHTLRAIEALAVLPEGKGAVVACLRRALESLSDPYILIMALLFHDLGKAGGEIHVEEGVQITRQVCKRIGVSADDQERIAFLVHHHLLMTHLSMYRDVDDEDIIRSFAGTMQSDERLRNLFLLSYADLYAVGPSVWNEWKGALLLKLYLKAEKHLLGKVETVGERYWHSPKVDEARALTAPELQGGVESHVRVLGERYLIAFAPAHIARHVELIARAQQSGLAVDCVALEEAEKSEVTISCRDCHGLFAKIAGCFASQLIDIRSAALFTRPDGYVVDTFAVADARRDRPLTARQAAGVERVLRAVLLGDADVQTYVDQSRRRLFALLQPRLPVRTRISFDNDSSRTHTVIDIETGDRTGLLYDLTRAMADAGLDISTARIVTDARHVRDSFYVTINNSKIEEEGQQAAIREALHNAIHPRPAAEIKGGVS